MLDSADEARLLSNDAVLLADGEVEKPGLELEPNSALLVLAVELKVSDVVDVARLLVARDDIDKVLVDAGSEYVESRLCIDVSPLVLRSKLDDNSILLDDNTDDGVGSSVETKLENELGSGDPLEVLAITLDTSELDVARVLLEGCNEDELEVGLERGRTMLPVVGDPTLLDDGVGNQLERRLDVNGSLLVLSARFCELVLIKTTVSLDICTEDVLELELGLGPLLLDIVGGPMLLEDGNCGRLETTLAVDSPLLVLASELCAIVLVKPAVLLETCKSELESGLGLSTTLLDIIQELTVVPEDVGSQLLDDERLLLAVATEDSVLGTVEDASMLELGGEDSVEVVLKLSRSLLMLATELGKLTGAETPALLDVDAGRDVELPMELENPPSVLVTLLRIVGEMEGMALLDVTTTNELELVVGLQAALILLEASCILEELCAVVMLEAGDEDDAGPELALELQLLAITAVLESSDEDDARLEVPLKLQLLTTATVLENIHEDDTGSELTPELQLLAIAAVLEGDDEIATDDETSKEV